MKLRFALINGCSGFRKEVTFIAFDTQEVSAWLLSTLKDDLNGLELFFKGVADSVFIKEEDVGSPVFQKILNFLGAEFPDIENLRPPAPTELNTDR